MRFFAKQGCQSNAIRVLLFAVVFSLTNSIGSAANIGTAVPVIGQVADLVHDAKRNLVYLANATRNQIEIYSVDGGRLTGSILAGLQPGSLALSPDLDTLYVA